MDKGKGISIMVVKTNYVTPVTEVISLCVNSDITEDKVIINGSEEGEPAAKRFDVNIDDFNFEDGGVGEWSSDWSSEWKSAEE